MSAHFCAAVPNFRVMEIDPDDVPWKDDILTWKPEIINGDLIVPHQPGWGAELNEEIFKEASCKIHKGINMKITKIETITSRFTI